MATNFHRPQHRYDINYAGVTDQDTLKLVKDFVAMYRAVYQGAMMSDWLEARVMRLIKKYSNC